MVIPMDSAISFIERASFSACSCDCINAPFPVLTSRTREVIPSAAFFEMMLLVMSGTDAMSPVKSLNAYILRSAGTKSWF